MVSFIGRKQCAPRSRVLALLQVPPRHRCAAPDCIRISRRKYWLKLLATCWHSTGMQLGDFAAEQARACAQSLQMPCNPHDSHTIATRMQPCLPGFPHPYQESCMTKTSCSCCSFHSMDQAPRGEMTAFSAWVAMRVLCWSTGSGRAARFSEGIARSCSKLRVAVGRLIRKRLAQHFFTT